MIEKILFDEQGLKPGTLYEKGQWKGIASHNEIEVKGFFGEYRFLSNSWPAKVFLDGDEYRSTENAYQAAKYKKEERAHLQQCTPRGAIVYVREHPMTAYTPDEWGNAKLNVMKELLVQKFDPALNSENHQKLLDTGSRYLEETNYWGDIYWGINKSEASEAGEGQNNLGKLLMEIRGKYVL